MVSSTGKPNRPFAASGSCATAVWSVPGMHRTCHHTQERGKCSQCSRWGFFRV